MEEITEKIVVEARLKGQTIRKIAEVTGIPYNRIMSVLVKTQIDDKKD